MPEVYLCCNQYSLHGLCGGNGYQQCRGVSFCWLIELNFICSVSLLHAQVRGVLEEQTKKHFSEFMALQYRTQVVNGINYFIKASGRMCTLLVCTLHL